MFTSGEHVCIQFVFWALMTELWTCGFHVLNVPTILTLDGNNYTLTTITKGNIRNGLVWLDFFLSVNVQTRKSAVFSHLFLFVTASCLQPGRRRWSGTGRTSTCWRPATMETSGYGTKEWADDTFHLSHAELHVCLSAVNVPVISFSEQKPNTAAEYVAAHLSKIHGLDWHPDNEFILATSSQDNSVRVRTTNSLLVNQRDKDPNWTGSEVRRVHGTAVLVQDISSQKRNTCTHLEIFCEDAAGLSSTLCLTVCVCVCVCVCV